MLSGKRILVVDDEPGIRDLASRALSAAGAHVATAGDGHIATKLLEGGRIDLVVIDIIMPDKEGVETIIEIKKRWPACKIIAISGGGQVGPQTFLTLASAFGADAGLKKPLSFAQLVQTAGILLETHAHAR